MSFILWALDTLIDARRFERLCTDLLAREGFPHIVPYGGVHDRGRDAEAVGVAADSTGSRTFFQFSLQGDWERKLASELAKVRSNGHQITDYVFVTSRDVTGAARDRWVARVATDFGWRLHIFEREWLRHRLEERHPDLAERYLPYPAPPTDSPRVAIPTSRAHGDPGDPASPWHLAQEGRHQEAIAAFTALTLAAPFRADVWAGLAWSQYQCFHYEDAVVSSERALSLEPTDQQWQALRACVLTEFGIHSGSRASVIEGSRIFSRLARDSDRWTDHYNAGNALAALDDHGAAVVAYRRAVALDPSQPTAWKNLGSSHHHLGAHDEEMVCLDRALEIEPDHPQALISKGISLLVDRSDASGAVTLLERARSVAPAIFVQWSHAWEWLVRAYRVMGQEHTALARVRQGVRAVPGSTALRRLEGAILHRLWPTDRSLIPDAVAVNDFLHTLIPDEYGYIEELIRLHLALGEEESGWTLLVEWLAHQSFRGTSILRDIHVSLGEIARALRYLPHYLTFRSYWPTGEYLLPGDTAATIPALSAALTSPETEGALSLAFAVPFGLAIDALQHPTRRRPRAALLRAMGPARDTIARAVPEVFRFFAQQVASGEPSQEVAVEALTEGVVHAPIIAILELSRVLGWLVALTGVAVSEDDLDQVSRRLRYSDAQYSVLEQSLVRMNDVFRLLPVDE